MKKFIKTIAALSTMAVIAIPANLTASAYPVSYNNYNQLKNTCDSSSASGYSWDTMELQDGLPTFSQKWLNKYKTIKPTFYFQNASPCHMFALLDQTAGKISDLTNTKKNVDKISVRDYDTNTDYALVLEYQDNSCEGECPEYADFGLRMFDQYWLETDILSKFFIQSVKPLTAENVMEGFTGTLVLRNYYVAGLKVESSDPYTTFEEPVIVRNGNNIRTEVTFHIRNPFPQPYTLFGNNSISGYYTKKVLENVKFTYNCNGSFSTTTNNFKTTLKLPQSRIGESNTLYQGLIVYPTLATKAEGDLKEKFDKNEFKAAKVENGILFIYIGTTNTGISDPAWINGNGSAQFEAFFRCGGRDTLGRCQWIRDQLKKVNQVRFFRDATKSSYGTQFHQCSASELINRINNG